MRRQSRFFSGKGSVDLVSRGTTVEGNITVSSTIRVEGKVRGNIVAEPNEREGDVEVHVIEGGQILGNICARRVVIEGEVKGDVLAEELVELYAFGRLEGKVVTPRFTVQPGGVFLGESKALTQRQKGSRKKRSQ